MRLAEYVGQCVRDLEPENIEVYDLPAIPDRSDAVKALPGVLYVLQPQTQMEAMGYNTLIYGWDGNHILHSWHAYSSRMRWREAALLLSRR